MSGCGERSPSPRREGGLGGIGVGFCGRFIFMGAIATRRASRCAGEDVGRGRRHRIFRGNPQTCMR